MSTYFTFVKVTACISYIYIFVMPNSSNIIFLIWNVTGKHFSSLHISTYQFLCNTTFHWLVFENDITSLNKETDNETTIIRDIFAGMMQQGFAHCEEPLQIAVCFKKSKSIFSLWMQIFNMFENIDNFSKSPKVEITKMKLKCYRTCYACWFTE